MRKILLVLVLALLGGAAVVWLMQQGAGYLLISFGKISIEMSLWVAGVLYLITTLLVVWLVLLVKWLIAVGGLRQWWASRRQVKQLSKTAQGLLKYADKDWVKAKEILASSAQLSSMSDINLLFAAQAAAEANDNEAANRLLLRLQTSHPNAAAVASKQQIGLLVNNGQLDQALAQIQPLYRDNPSDTGLIRLLVNIYCQQHDWYSAQRLLRDIEHYKVLPKEAVTALQINIYVALLNDCDNKPELSEVEQYDQLSELWGLVPKALRKMPELIAPYADALARINATEKLLPLLSTALNSQWHQDLVQRFGLLTMANTEKQFSTAEKWLLRHPQDADLLLALGRICIRLELRGKAKDYLNSALKLDRQPSVYFELAQLLQIMGEAEDSAEMYRQGLEVAVAR
jgi:HemY protein